MVEVGDRCRKMAIEPNTDEAPRAAAIATDAYMHTVAIVQSIALVLLLQESALSKYVLGEDSFDWLAVLQAIVGFGVIVLAWHTNLQVVLAFKRVYNMIDTFLTFFFVVPEYALIYFSQPSTFSKWSFSFGWVALLATIANFCFRWLAERDFPEDNGRIVAAVGEGYWWWTVVLCAFAAAISFLSGSLAKTVFWQIVAAIVICLLLAAFAWRFEVFFVRRVRGIHTRRPERAISSKK